MNGPLPRVTEAGLLKLWESGEHNCKTFDELREALSDLHELYSMSPTPAGLMPTARGLEFLVGA